MAKLKSNSITETDLSEYLNSYSDFSFELRVLKMLREKGLQCEHGGHYRDPVTDKSREYDIRATKTIKNKRLRMAVECKNIGKNFPLLVSCIPRKEQESYHQIALVGERKEQSLLDNSIFNSRARPLSLCGHHSLYKIDNLVGKSTAQVGRGADNTISYSDSEIYEKWGQCLSSANDLIDRVYEDGSDDNNRYLSAVIPFVAVPDTRLWMAAYNDEGDLVRGPVATDRVSLFIGRAYEMGERMARETLWLSHLEIVTFRGMITFVEDHLRNENGLEKIFPGEGISAARYGSST